MDRDKLWEQYRYYIRFLARRYSIPGHFLLNVEDLEAEGFVVLVELTKHYDTEEEFERNFKTSLRNRYRDLWRWACRPFRKAITVDLSEVYELVGEDGFDSIYIDEKLKHARSMLSNEAWEVLTQLINPDDELVEIAVARYIRKKHVLKVNKRFNIDAASLAKYLGLTITDVNQSIEEVKQYVTT